jgi:hypothetical protein
MVCVTIGQHEAVLIEYRKVLALRDSSKTLRGSGQAKLISMIVADVEKAVDAFRNQLLRSLIDPTKGVEHHKLCIAYGLHPTKA